MHEYCGDCDHCTSKLITLLGRIRGRLEMSELYLAAAEKDLSAFEVALAGGAVTGGNDFAIDSSTQITGFLDDTLWDLHWVMDGIEPFILLETIANNNPDDGIVALQELFNHHFGLNGWNFEKCLSGEEVFDGV